MILTAILTWALFIEGASIQTGLFIVAGLFDLAMAETIFDSGE